MNPHLYKTVGYDTLKDFVPVATVADLPLLLVAHPSQPFGTVAELQAYARAHPGQLKYSSSGNGTLSHLGLVAPRGTPPELVARLGAEVVGIVQDPANAEPLAALGAVPRAGGGDALRAILVREYEMWGRLVRESGARVE